MKYKFLGAVSLALMIVQFVRPVASMGVIPLVLSVLLVRNPRSLVRYARVLLPSALFIMVLYILFGRWREGLGIVSLLTGTSLCLQLYLAFFPDRSLYVLLRETGFPERPAFIVYGAVNYTLLIKPMILEIRDAQRLRGLDISQGIRGLFHIPRLLIPLTVRLLKGADHLAESLYLRAYVSADDSRPSRGAPPRPPHEEEEE